MNVKPAKALDLCPRGRSKKPVHFKRVSADVRVSLRGGRAKIYRARHINRHGRPTSGRSASGDRPIIPRNIHVVPGPAPAPSPNGLELTLSTSYGFLLSKTDPDSNERRTAYKNRNFCVATRGKVTGGKLPALFHLPSHPTVRRRKQTSEHEHAFFASHPTGGTGGEGAASRRAQSDLGRQKENSGEQFLSASPFPPDRFGFGLRRLVRRSNPHQSIRRGIEQARRGIAGGIPCLPLLLLRLFLPRSPPPADLDSTGLVMAPAFHSVMLGL